MVALFYSNEETFSMMHRIPTLIVCALLFAACGGDPHEKAANDALDAMEEIVTTLEGVTDKASAEAARSKLEKLQVEMKATTEKAKALGDLPPEKAAELAEKMGARSQELMQRMMAAMMKIQSNPEAAAALDKTLDNMR